MLRRWYRRLCFGGDERVPGLGRGPTVLLRLTWVKGQSGLVHLASYLQFGWTKRHLSPNLQLGKVLRKSKMRKKTLWILIWWVLSDKSSIIISAPSSFLRFININTHLHCVVGWWYVHSSPLLQTGQNLQRSITFGFFTGTAPSSAISTSITSSVKQRTEC